MGAGKPAERDDVVPTLPDLDNASGGIMGLVQNKFKNHFNLLIVITNLLGIIFLCVPCFILEDQTSLLGFQAFYLNGIKVQNIILLIFAISLGANLIIPFIKYKNINGEFSLLFSILNLIISISTTFVLKEYLNQTVYVNFGIILCDIFLSFAFLLSIGFSNIKEPFKVKEITRFAILIALAVLLDLIPVPPFKFRITPTGGSISFSMLPLILLALDFSFAKSFIGCGLIFGLVTCLTDGYGIYTLPFDYFLGFGCLAIFSFFKYLTKLFKFKKHPKVLNFIILFFYGSIVVTLRVLSSTLSSMIFYNLTFGAGFVYNAIYVYPSFGLCYALIVVLKSTLMKD